MRYPPEVSATAVRTRFLEALAASMRAETPYRHWNLADVLPIELCTAILAMPIRPAELGKTDGTRGSYNQARCFLTPRLCADYQGCAALAEALQDPSVARVLAATCEIEVEGSFLRMEYMQDVDGAWLEPHRDIPEKLFSMVIYLCTGPEAGGWGTDIYDAEQRWVGRSSAEFDSAVIFIPGPASWHGFEPRPIEGVRRLMEINYVRPTWRDREQLTFPDRPIRLS